MKKLAPFMRFFGSKFNAAHKYPSPEHYDTIIEPFAGGAGFSLRYHEKNVILIEKDPVIASIWKYLISADEQEILACPPVDNIEDLPEWVPEGLKFLVGMRFSACCTAPRRALSAGMRKFREQGRLMEGWSEGIIRRTAENIKYIRHWQIIEGDYTSAPNTEAYWFIDPPYEQAGKSYKCSSRYIDFNHLGTWCQSREGKVVVCENYGATWLPFERFGPERKNGMHGKISQEAVWFGGTRHE